jgi:hypothetical protein
MSVRGLRAALRARWPAARAALIALAIGLALVDGCPVPERQVVPAWATGLVDGLQEARTVARKPVAKIATDLDVFQRWILFRGASRKRFRLYVEARAADGDWQLLYRAGDPEHAAYEDLLKFRRIRGTYNPNGQNARSQYLAFAIWMTRRVLDDHPEFLMARTRLEKVVIGEGEYTGTGEFAFTHQELRRRK